MTRKEAWEKLNTTVIDNLSKEQHDLLIAILTRGATVPFRKAALARLEPLIDAACPEQRATIADLIELGGIAWSYAW